MKPTLGIMTLKPKQGLNVLPMRIALLLLMLQVNKLSAIKEVDLQKLLLVALTILTGCSWVKSTPTLTLPLHVMGTGIYKVLRARAQTLVMLV